MGRPEYIKWVQENSYYYDPTYHDLKLYKLIWSTEMMMYYKLYGDLISYVQHYRRYIGERLND